MTIGVGSSLFEDMVYYHIKRTDKSLPKIVMERGVKSEELISKNIKNFKGHYIKFSMDPHGII